MRFRLKDVCCAVALAMSWGLALNLTFAQPGDSNSRGERDDVWVRDVRPGVKLYGRINEFAEIGSSHQFDLSPDGRTIVFFGDNFRVSSEVKFWDVENQKVTRKLQLQNNVLDAIYSADGLKLFVTEQPANPNDLQSVPEALFTVWNAVTLQKIAQIAPPPRQVRRKNTIASISADSERVALSYGNRLQIHDLGTGDIVSESIREIPGFFVVNDDAKQLIDMYGNVIDVTTGEATSRLPSMRDKQYMNNLTISPRSNLIAGTIWDKGVRLFDLDTGKAIELQQPDRPSIQMFPVSFSNDGKFLAAGSSHYPPLIPRRLDFLSPVRVPRSRIFVWDTKSGDLISTIKTRGGHINRMRFSVANKQLYTKAWRENGVTVHDIHPTGDADASKLTGNVGPISGFHFFDRQDAIVVSSQFDPVLIYDLKSGRPIVEIFDQETSYMDTTSNGSYVVVASEYSNIVKIHNTKNRKTKFIDARLVVPPSPVARFADLLTCKPPREFSEDFVISEMIVSDDSGHVSVVALGNRVVRIQKFDISTGKQVARKRFQLEKYWDNPQRISMMSNQRRVVVAPDGRWLAIASEKEDIFVVDAESGDLLHEFKGAGENYSQLFVAPDSENLIVVGNTLKFIDVVSGEATLPSPELKPADFLVAISGKGNRIAMITGGPADNRKLEVYDLRNPQELSQIFSQKLDRNYQAIGISRRGDKIALARTDSHFEIWDLNELE